MPKKKELLLKGLDELKIKYSEKIIEDFLFYLEELEKWNSRINLVRATGEELVTGHILDSLAGLPLLLKLKKRRSLIDIGSGAGFPGIPLALFLRNTPVTLCDTLTKRTVFLQSIKYLLHLKHVEVVQKDYKKLKDKFDVVTFRAFTQVNKEISPLFRLLTRSGSIFAYKGKKEKIDEELGILKKTGVKYKTSVEKISVPFLDRERHIVILEKG